MQINILRSFCSFLIISCSSFSFAQTDYTTPSRYMESICDQIKGMDLGQKTDVKSEIQSLIKDFPKVEFDKALYATLVGNLESENTTSCSLADLNLIVTSIYPVASQIAVVNKSVQAVESGLRRPESSIQNLSELSDSIAYLLALSEFPKDSLIKNANRFLSEKIKDDSLDFRYRYYAFLVLSSQSDGNCPRFPVDLRILFPSNMEGVEFPSIKNSSQCKSVAFEDALNTIKILMEAGDLEALKTSLGFFSLLYASVEDTRQINLTVVKYSLSNPKVRPVAFPLINRDIISFLNMGEKAQLLALGQMPFTVYLVLIASFTLPIIAYFVVLLFFKLRSSSREASEKKKAKKAKSKAPEKKVASDEYSILLESFGLDDRATEADIKKAYRELARKFHPDSADQHVREDFEKVQSNYDKLMKLRKGWFGLSR